MAVTAPTVRSICHDKNAGNRHNGYHCCLPQNIDQVPGLQKAFIPQDQCKQYEHSGENNINHILIPLYILFIFAGLHIVIPPLNLFCSYPSLQ